MNTEPLYPFGFGLTYSDISYGSLKSSTKKIKKGEIVTLDIEVMNKSNRDASAVLQVYVSKVNKSDTDPNHSLKSFKRLEVKANSNAKASFELDDTAFSQYDDNGDLELIRGEYDVTISSSAPTYRSAELGCDQKQTKKPVPFGAGFFIT